MTKRQFKMALLVAASLGLMAATPAVLVCYDTSFPSGCAAISPFVNWVGSISIFVFFIFIFLPLVFTFLGLPLMASLTPRETGDPLNSLDPFTAFFVIREWAKVG